MFPALSDTRYIRILLFSVTGLLAWSAINPHDWFTWFLEVFPVLTAIILLTATYSRFRFTRLVYLLIALHSVVLIVGGHYTYAEMPLFNWLRDTYDLGRNHYDRFAHITQGFFPAIIVREILVRLSPIKQGAWLFFTVVCICLAISAFYEMIEWWVAVASGSSAVAFLATQGDIWDTQWDMFLALCGATVSLLMLGGYHDQAIRKETKSTAGTG